MFLENHRDGAVEVLKAAGLYLDEKTGRTRNGRCLRPAGICLATVNLPHARRAPREETFYLTCWTRAAEADLLGTRTLKTSDFDRRIVWLFRREVSADQLVHYHAVVKFPLNRPWRDERPDFYSVIGAANV